MDAGQTQTLDVLDGIPQSELDTRIHFMGDIHGTLKPILEWNQRHTRCSLIQVGDFNIGYPFISLEKLQMLSLFLERRFNKLFIIRGNHDDPSWFDGRQIGETIRLIPDNHVLNIKGRRIFVCGGGISVDRVFSTKNTQLRHFEKEAFHWDGSLPIAHTVDMVVTHAAGSWTARPIDTAFMSVFYKEDATLRASIVQERADIDKLMAAVLESQPHCHKWIHGHLHTPMEHHISGITFRGLGANDDLEVVDFNLHPVEFWVEAPARKPHKPRTR